MTNLSDEQAANRAAIRKARNSTKPAVPAEQVLTILKADLVRVLSVWHISQDKI